LLLIAVDQVRDPFRRVLPILIVAVFGAYGLVSYLKNTHDLVRKYYYDRASNTTMISMPGSVLEYLRSELAAHHWQRAIAVIPQPEVANGLPGFRTIFSFSLLDYAPLSEIARQRWAGRTDKIFVIVPEGMLQDGKAEAVLRTFVDYDDDKWTQMHVDRMVIYSQ
jgi:hypothetical protein